MKRLAGKGRRIVRGMPSGVALSLAIHAALFLLAGMLVVFTVQNKEEKRFVPPKPVDRPKMQLRKPKVQVKKSAQPKPTTRIVTKVARADMPDIRLPEMGGMAEGLAGGIGGFDLMPDLGGVTLFGGGQTIGNDFVGTFYDFKRDRRGRTVAMDPEKFMAEVRKFVVSGFRLSSVAKYYRSPKKLYATSFLIPTILSTVAPSAFGESDTLGYCWLAHYKGLLTHSEDIRFRFWGHGDDVMVVRVDGEIVLGACWPGDFEEYMVGGVWSSSAKNNRRFYLGNNLAVIGDWIELKAGEPKEMEIIIGEVPGGAYCAMLCVEVDGVEYERNRQGGPILPMFKTEEPSLDLLDAIYRDLVAGEASPTNGPVFRDYALKPREPRPAPEADDGAGAPPEAPQPASKMRTWTLDGGQRFEAEFVATMGDRVVLKTAKGKQERVPAGRLSAEDLEHIELATPPSFRIDFSNKSSQRILETSPFNEQPPPRILDYVFGAKLRPADTRPYSHELTIEYFAIGSEIGGDKFVLADRREGVFNPSEEKDRSFEFYGDPVEFVDFELHEQRRGTRYAGYLVTLTDKRGEIIQHNASNPWLWENLENLKKIPVGKYMDKNCLRVHPTGPKRFFW